MSRATAFALLVSCLVVASPSVGRANDRAEARREYEVGAELAARRRHADAIEHFLASHRLARSVEAALGLARAFRALRRHEDSFNWYTTVVADDETDDDTRALATSELEALAPLVAVIDVDTAPPDARLVVGDTELGLSPRPIAVPPGRHRVTARLAGYHDASRETEATAGARTALTLDLAPITGRLLVETEPPNATVRSGDEQLGRTPLEIDRPVGAISLRIDHEGYLGLQRNVQVAEGAIARVTVTLARDVARLATLEVDGDPAGAIVFLNGRRLGRTPLSIGELVPSRSRIEVRAPGRETWRHRVRLVSGASTHVSYRLSVVEEEIWAGWRILGAGLGGASIAAGVVLGGIAAGERDALFSSRDSDELERVDALGITATSLVLGGIATVLVTSLLDVFADEPDAPSSGEIEIVGREPP